jgi:hypothetical protein
MILLHKIYSSIACQAKHRVSKIHPKYQKMTDVDNDVQDEQYTFIKLPSTMWPSHIFMKIRLHYDLPYRDESSVWERIFGRIFHINIKGLKEIDVPRQSATCPTETANSG